MLSLCLGRRAEMRNGHILCYHCHKRCCSQASLCIFFSFTRSIRTIATIKGKTRKDSENIAMGQENEVPYKINKDQ